MLNKSLLVVLVTLGLIGAVYAVQKVNANPNSLAADVQTQILCPAMTQRALVCATDASGTTTSTHNISFLERIFGRRPSNGCNWQCLPIPSMSLMPTPRISPFPRATTPPFPSMTPKVCPVRIICPLNCTAQASSDFNGCQVCNCGGVSISQ